MSKPGAHLKAAAVDNPWTRVPGGAGHGATQAGGRARGDGIADRVCAALIIGLVVVMALGWLALGASYARGVQRDGAAAAAIGTITVGHPELAGQEPAADTGAINVAAWMPVWIGVDLTIFLALGLFLRCDRGRKP